jgi:hypothetical protein
MPQAGQGNQPGYEQECGYCAPHHNLDHSIVLKVEPIGDYVEDDQNTEGPNRGHVDQD